MECQAWADGCDAEQKTKEASKTAREEAEKRRTRGSMREEERGAMRKIRA